MKRFKHPFTLIELLCVIIVIALLAAISIKVTQIAYRRADETKTKTAMEIIRTANEQYKAKKGYYLPNTSSDLTSVSAGSSGTLPSGTSFYKIKFCNKSKGYAPTEFGEFLGDSFNVFLEMPCTDEANREYLRDAWGNEFRYSSPGIFNRGTFDLYSKGRDTSSGDAEKSVHRPGDGDDIANFKNPDLK